MRHTNLIVHHRVANVLDQATKFISILDVVEGTLSLPLVLIVEPNLDGRLPAS